MKTFKLVSLQLIPEDGEPENIEIVMALSLIKKMRQHVAD